MTHVPLTLLLASTYQLDLHILHPILRIGDTIPCTSVNYCGKTRYPLHRFTLQVIQHSRYWQLRVLFNEENTFQ